MTINYNVSAYASGTYNTGSPIVTTANTTNASGSSFLAICIAYFSGAVFVVNDSKANTYSILGTQQNNSSDSNSVAMYLCQGGAGGASHTFNSNTSNGTGAGGALFIVELTGGPPTGINDQFYGNVGFLGNPTSGPVTPTQNNELVLSLVLSGNTVTFTPSGGFSTLLNDAQSSLMVKAVTGGDGIVQDPNPSFTPSGGRTTILTASFVPQTAAPASSYYMSSSLEF